jgi:hypothetical protein
VFLGVLLGISTKQYNKTTGAPDGDLIISEVDGEKFPALGVNGTLEDLTNKDMVKLNVVDKTGSAPVPNIPVINPANMTLSDEIPPPPMSPPVQS